jgi:uncharacterized protein (DUF1778 family)
MPPHQSSAPAQSRKTARMEQRITPQTKALIEQAATLLGINPSEFVTVAAAKMAHETVQGYQRTTLTPPAHAAFAQALDATEPTANLIELMRLHAEATGSE